jgi:hypothetical protein
MHRNRGDGAEGSEDGSYQSENHGVAHRIAGRDPCREVTAENREDNSVGKRQGIQAGLRHWVAPGRIYLKNVKHLVGAEGKDDHGQESDDDGGDAS